MRIDRLLDSTALIRRFSDDRKGVSAIEFALIAPLLVTLYFGGIEITTAVAVDRKMTLVAHTVADLVAQSSSITNSEMTDILNAASAIASPYTTANLKVVVSSVVINSSNVATIAWSDTLNGTKHTVGETVTLPGALNIKDSSLIWGEVTYTYKPMFGTVFKTNLTLGDMIYMRPRISATVARTAS
jgi:Flp pilus assembly protein TadG